MLTIKISGLRIETFSRLRIIGPFSNFIDRPGLFGKNVVLGQDFWPTSTCIKKFFSEAFFTKKKDPFGIMRDKYLKLNPPTNGKT